MKLSDWLEKREISHTDFGRRIGKRQQEVWRYCAGTVIPNAATMAVIVLATDGAVQANDFYADHIAAARARLKSSTSPLALRAGKGRAA